MTAGWSAVYNAVQWIQLYLSNPVHLDFATFYAAAEAGLRYGWPKIYDLDTLRALTASFPDGQDYISSAQLYVNPPLLAWLVSPLTTMPIPTAYLLWTLASLGALVWAWHICAPGQGLAKLALLLTALALWPVLNVFFYGQPTILVLALVAGAWWLCDRQRPVAAGAILAVATALKPQLMILVPLALLVGGRYRLVAAWGAGCAIFAAVFALVLGPSGLSAWWHALTYLQSNPIHSRATLAFVFGEGTLTYGLLALQAVAAMLVAWRRRGEAAVVFATGLLGSIMFSFHLHAPDYAVLVLAAWLVLRSSAPLWQRIWLVPGLVTMQVLSLGQPIPQLAWDVVWLTILAIRPARARQHTAPTGLTATEAESHRNPVLQRSP